MKETREERAARVRAAYAAEKPVDFGSTSGMRKAGGGTFKILGDMGPPPTAEWRRPTPLKLRPAKPPK